MLRTRRTRPIPSAWLALVLTSPPLLAQDVAWDIPAAGAVEYERSLRVHVAPPSEVGRDGLRIVRLGDAEWRYRTGDHPTADESFVASHFDDSGWATGRTPFGSGDETTRWPADERFLEARLRFEIDSRPPRAAVVTVRHDDECRVWLNGLPIVHAPGAHHGSRWFAIEAESLDAFVRGENVLAVRVENTGGPGHFDLGVTTFGGPFSEPGGAVSLVRAADEAADRLTRDLFPDFRAPAFLCAGQLDARRERVALPTIDLRELGSWLAFDLRRAGASRTVSETLHRTWQFGDLDLSGRVAPPASSGVQRIEVELASEEPATLGDDRRFVRRWVLPRWDHELSGRIDVERRVDLERCVVSGFTSRLDAELRPRGGDLAGRTFRLTIDDEWRFVRKRENRDAEFRARVVDAIRSGGEWLVREVGDPNRRKFSGEIHDHRSYGTGRLAIALLAMVHAEVPRDHPVLVRGFDELRRRKLVDTYSTAHAIMALEAFYAPRGELEELRSGRLDRPRQRRPSAEDRALLEEWTATLLRNVDSRVDPAYVLRFNYVNGPRYDNSVDQYGLLGLYSAHLCGVEVSPSVWNAAATHLVADQSDPVGRRELTLTTYRQLDEIAAGRTTSSGARTTKLAGWGYQEAKEDGVERPIYAAMTCAGISGLTICLAGLRDAGVTRAELTGAADTAIRQGFAWLAEHFTVHWHVGRVQQPFSWVYYYLYGLERACELSGIARIDHRDWYYEGALTLLDQQRPDGSWPRDAAHDDVVEQSAMAILFLKQASLPVYTGR